MTAIEIKSLKSEVKKLIDEADDRMVRAIHAMLKSDQEADWWDEISDDEKEAIETGIKQLENGEGIPHSEVKKLYPKWFTK